MNFYAAWLRALLRRPAAALEALFWHITGRKQRARNRLRMIGAQSPFAYQMWMQKVEPAQLAMGNIADWTQRPLISVILYDHADQSPGHRERTLASLLAQHYPEWELVLVPAPDSPRLSALVPRLTVADAAGNAAEALNIGTMAAAGQYILPLAVGVILTPTALYHYAQALQDQANAPVVLFGDQDELSARGLRTNPWFKPRWNPELLLAQDYISPACLIRTADARAALPIPAALADAANYVLVLAVTSPQRSGDDTPQVSHIPHILAHLPAHRYQAHQAARIAAVGRQLARTGAAISAGPFGSVRVDWPLPDPPPLVSIIIPTRDQVRLLRTCVQGVLDHTSYHPFEVIIVDNGSRDADALAYLQQVSADSRVRVLDYDHPFNFSAINNFAARQAQGSYLCLLNNDIEIIDPNWLTALMRQAARPHVGAAGAKLLYADRTIQHAGVVIGLGQAAGHAHRYQRNDQPGYFARAHLTHRVSAVTAACLVVAKAKFDAVGGFGEVDFAVAFNDVDLCLKLQRAGWHNLYVPQAVAIHHESKSRGRDFSPENVVRYRGELAALQERWATLGYRDPLHHAHFAEDSETYLIKIGI